MIFFWMGVFRLINVVAMLAIASTYILFEGWMLEHRALSFLWFTCSTVSFVTAIGTAHAGTNPYNYIIMPRNNENG